MPNVFIIEDQEDFRRLLRQHILSKWPDATLAEHDPATMGPVPAEFDGRGYDIVLLDYRLGEKSGLDYLKRFRRIAGFPPVIMLTAAGSERVAVEAIKLGAADYLPKQQMTHAALIGVMEEALDARGAVERFQEQHPAPSFPGLSDTGLRIKGYRNLALLGHGGMAAVYRAQPEEDGESMVLKVISRTSQDAGPDSPLTRFFQEYQIVSRLRHPGIVRIFEQGFTDEYAFLAMEYFPGGDLRERIRSGLTVDDAVTFTRAIAEALEPVHAAGVVHRDLKPSNVMFRADGTLALIDFGVAKLSGLDLDLTRTGTVVGTPHYMSPEQSEGLTLDSRSDFYSLGVVFYEMLTGAVPYTAATPLAVMYKHKHAPVPKLPEPLAELQPVMERLLAKDPDARFQLAGELIQSLPPEHSL